MRKKILHILALLLLMVWSGSFTVAAQSTSSPENVTGVVISAINKKPLRGAYIRVKGTNVETSTTYSGYFSTKAQKSDTLIISCLSFEDKYVTVDKHDLRISLMPPTFFCNRIYLSEELQIGFWGEVYDQDAKPLPGANVTFLPSGKKVTTDKKGFFSISEIEEDDNIVIVEHPYYKPVKGAINGNYFIFRLEKNVEQRDTLQSNQKNSSNSTFLYLELDIRDKSSYPITMRAITDKLNLDSLNCSNTKNFLSSIYSQGHYIPNLLIYDKVLIELSRVNNDSLLLKYSGQGQQLMNKLYSNSREMDFKLCDGKNVFMRVTQITGKFAICKKDVIALPTISDEISITKIKEITDIYIPIEIVDYKKPPKRNVNQINQKHF